mmetsp:Transcript_8247/g.10307  ORF Transcript_8247/g.10307 Transcript_8247/m.10307 type:complete len:316 (+) Transcript_8247:77-1024(+)
MTNIATTNSIRLKIKKIIWSESRHRSQTGLESNRIREESNEGNLNTNLEDEIMLEGLDVFNRYRNNDIVGERYGNIDRNSECAMNRSKVKEVFGELLDMDFDTSSELNEDDESVMMELTPFEEIPSRSNSFRQSIKNKLRKLLSNPPSEMLNKLEYEGENYSPISMKMPVIEDTEQYNRLDTLLFDLQNVEDPRIKFNQYVDVLVYNGNYNTPGGNLSDTIGSGRLWRNLSLRKSSFRNNYTASKSQIVRPILKSKTNENYEYEAFQIREFDKINFENFMNNFENYETCKLNQEPYLIDARLNQLKNYYHSNNKT